MEDRTRTAASHWFLPCRAALYAVPGDVESWVDAILWVKGDDLRRPMIDNGYARARTYFRGQDRRDLSEPDDRA